MTRELSWRDAVVDAASVPANGWHFRLEAGEADRIEIARRYDVPAVLSCAASCVILPKDGALAEVRIDLGVRLERRCVVTCEPMEEQIFEAFETTVLGADTFLTSDENAGDEDFEIALNGKIDLADLVVQHLAVAMTPYPRSADADTHLAEIMPQGKAAAELKNPFADLADRLYNSDSDPKAQ
ncbi:MAG: hypothetical protein OXD42_11470 [Rhodospirillaceae bacterium]|nr:hypothetical protein [Rhodospirillaceae bacterium]MCY4239834.1 hypothetical protein [Rhodospirillaceae bacterium]